eukprot:3820660-Ditylum_brightwellii.AAC.1
MTWPEGPEIITNMWSYPPRTAVESFKYNSGINISLEAQCLPFRPSYRTNNIFKGGIPGPD